jgi:hypothetical protein
MKNLKQYVASSNARAALFGDTPLDLNNPTDREVIAMMIEGDLSPENLTMDGELSTNEVSHRLKFFTACEKELAEFIYTLA